MRVETRKKLVLTKAEQRTIKELFTIFNEDKSLTLSDCWDLFQDIAFDEDAFSHGYDIDIID